MKKNQGMTSKSPDLIIDPSEFPVFLKARMMGQSMAQMAETLGVSQKLVYALLAGQRLPSKAILKKLGLGVYYGTSSPASTKRAQP